MRTSVVKMSRNYMFYIGLFSRPVDRLRRKVNTIICAYP